MVDVHLIDELGQANCYRVPKCLFCSASATFAEHFQREFSFRDTNAVYRLLACDKQTFDLFVMWLLFDEREGGISCFQTSREIVSQMSMVKLWCFGERYNIPNLQNSAMTMLMDILLKDDGIQDLNLGAMEHAMGKSRPDSCLQRFLIIVAAVNVSSRIGQGLLGAEDVEPRILGHILEEISARLAGHINSYRDDNGQYNLGHPGAHVMWKFGPRAFFVGLRSDEKSLESSQEMY